MIKTQNQLLQNFRCNKFKNGPNSSNFSNKGKRQNKFCRNPSEENNSYKNSFQIIYEILTASKTHNFIAQIANLMIHKIMTVVTLIKIVSKIIFLSTKINT